MSSEKQGAAPTAEQLEFVRRSHQAAVLRKWCNGSLLAAEEMAAVSHILPPALLVNPPRPKPRYRHEYEHYATALGYHVRNIKHWVTLGRDVRVPPPLDDPSALPNWWEQMRVLGKLKQQVPQRILDYAQRAAAAAAGAAAPASTPLAANAASATGAPPLGATPPGAPGTKKVNFAELEAIGLEGAVRELTLQLSAAQLLLREAREAGLDEVTINRRQKSFDATLDSLRKSEKAWQDLQIARGDLAPVADFRKDLVTIASTLRGMMRRRADNVCAKLADSLAPDQVAAVRAAIEAEGEREQTLLRSARHWRSPDPAAAAAPAAGA